jgi:hypothetical protein
MNVNRCIRRLRVAAILGGSLVGAALVSSQAYAQAWLPDRAYTEGPGIRAGDLEIHPGIAVRGGYDTNVFRADGKRRIVDDPRTPAVDPISLTQRRQGAGILAVTPHVHLSTLSNQRRNEGEDRTGENRALPPIAFRGGVSATYFHYFIDGAPRNVAIDTDLWVGILPQRPFNIDLGLSYVRSVNPFTQFAGSRNAYNYDSIQPRVRFNVGSRSQVLTSYIGYAPRITLYESSVFDYLSNFSHGVEAGAAWKFLPHTALIYDANLDFQRYNNDIPTQTISPVLYSDSTRFRTRLGVNGAFTRTLSLRILAGYAMVDFNRTQDHQRLDNHEDVVGEAILGWRFGPGKASLWETGYQRDVVTSALGGWTKLDRGFTNLRALLGGVFQLSIEAGIAYVTYGALVGFDRRSGTAAIVPLGESGTDRDDIRLDGAIRGEYRVTNWLSLMADVSVQAVVTDFNYAVYFGLPGNTPVPDPAQYLTVIAFGGVRAHY